MASRMDLLSSSSLPEEKYADSDTDLYTLVMIERRPLSLTNLSTNTLLGFVYLTLLLFSRHTMATTSSFDGCDGVLALILSGLLLSPLTDQHHTLPSGICLLSGFLPGASALVMVIDEKYTPSPSSHMCSGLLFLTAYTLSLLIISIANGACILFLVIRLADDRRAPENPTFSDIVLHMLLPMISLSQSVSRERCSFSS